MPRCFSRSELRLAKRSAVAAKQVKPLPTTPGCKVEIANLGLNQKNISATSDFYNMWMTAAQVVAMRGVAQLRRQEGVGFRKLRRY